jgi:photosystem II stability/assembly factor-like uncharacterized protein
MTVAGVGSAMPTPTANTELGNPLDRPAQRSELAMHSVLLSVSGGRSGVLVAAGERGHVLISPDRGKSWSQSSVPVSVTLTSVHFAAGGQGLAVGHGLTVLRSVDGGRTWTRQLDGRSASRSFAAEAQVAASAGRVKLAAKLDRLAREGADKPLLDVLMVGPASALAVGAYGVVLASHDGGTTWTWGHDVLPDGEDRHINVIRRIGDSVWLAGEAGLLYRCADDVKHCEPVMTSSRATLFAMAGSGDTLVVASLRGELLVSVDGGRTWSVTKTQTEHSFTSAIVDPAAAGSFLLGDDGGAVWRLDATREHLMPTGLRSRLPIADLHLDKDRELTVVGMMGVEILGALPAANN